MGTERTNSLDASITRLEELSESVNDRLSCIETQFDAGIVEMRKELRAFCSGTDGTSDGLSLRFDTLDRKITSHSNRIMLIWGLIFVSQVLMICGVINR